MKRPLICAALAVSVLSLANCASEPQVIHEHHYYRTTTVRDVKPAAAPSYSKSASVNSNSPEAFQAVTPPGSFSQ